MQTFDRVFQKGRIVREYNPHETMAEIRSVGCEITERTDDRRFGRLRKSVFDRFYRPVWKRAVKRGKESCGRGHVQWKFQWECCGNESFVDLLLRFSSQLTYAEWTVNNVFGQLKGWTR
jgi:hypothetical protein